MKLLFGCSKYHSVRSTLLELGLPSFDTLIIINRRVNVRLLRVVLLRIHVYTALF